MGNKNKNYGSFYRPQQNEEVSPTFSYDNKTEEVQSTKEEAPIQEAKVEEVPTRKFANVAGADKVNMRKSPDINGAIIKALPKGTEVEVLGNAVPHWTKIAHNGEFGFMMTQYLKGK